MTQDHPLSLAVREASVPGTSSSDSEGMLLPAEAVVSISDSLGVPCFSVEQEALRLGILPERYLRNTSYLSLSEQLALLESHVLLVGLGGLGGHVLDMLCRMGVGRITGADGDVFETSNLNRQLLCSEKRVGMAKAEAAAEHVQQVNPAVRFTGLTEFLKSDRLLEELRGVDLVVDALGGLATRLELQRAAAECSVPMVTAAVAGLTGYVATVLPGEIGPAELFGTGSAAEDTLGTPAPVVGCAAAMQCAEAMLVLAGRDRPREVLMFDLGERTFDNVLL
jgi:sulfur carrier protein ThiS adenylyltransferase